MIQCWVSPAWITHCSWPCSGRSASHELNAHTCRFLSYQDLASQYQFYCNICPVRCGWQSLSCNSRHTDLDGISAESGQFNEVRSFGKNSKADLLECQLYQMGMNKANVLCTDQPKAQFTGAVSPFTPQQISLSGAPRQWQTNASQLKSLTPISKHEQRDSLLIPACRNITPQNAPDQVNCVSTILKIITV